VGTRTNPAWVELLQLAPIVSLALPFIIAGTVDLGRARGGFVVGALLFLAVSSFVLARGFVLNPIAVGTGLWLVAGAVAFVVPVPELTAWLAAVQAFALFLAVLAVAVVATLFSPQGYIGCQSDDRRFLTRASVILLAVTVGAVVWSFAFRHDLRLGGGLPFITVNLVRRALVLRAQRALAKASI